jgi:hypothetical protein
MSAFENRARLEDAADLAYGFIRNPERHQKVSRLQPPECCRQSVRDIVRCPCGAAGAVTAESAAAAPEVLTQVWFAAPEALAEIDGFINGVMVEVLVYNISAQVVQRAVLRQTTEQVAGCPAPLGCCPLGPMMSSRRPRRPRQPERRFAGPGHCAAFA